VIARIARIAAFALGFCLAVPAAAESRGAAEIVRSRPAPAALTVEQSREAQALFGFDVAIPVIIEQAFKEQPEYQTMTPAQRECVLGLASPAFSSLYDSVFVELFGDSEILGGWKAFSETPGGRIFLGNLRKTVLFKIDIGPEPDTAAAMDALSDAERADIVVFMDSRAASVMKKGFPDAKFSAEMEKTLLARTEKECGVTLDKL
jgi:hypothetical protein